MRGGLCQLIHPGPERRDRSIVERDVIRPPAAAPLFEHPHRHRQIEPPRTGARRVEVPHAAAPLVVGQMAVAEHHDVRRFATQRFTDGPAGAARPRKDVSQEDAQTSDLGADDFLPGRIIIVAAYEEDRRDLLERGDDSVTADIPGVQDVVDAGKDFGDAIVQAAMGVRDHTDFHDADHARSGLVEPRAIPPAGLSSSVGGRDRPRLQLESIRWPLA